MATSKNEEVAALEALRDSSADLVRYLDAMNDKLSQLNQQNERTVAARAGELVERDRAHQGDRVISNQQDAERAGQDAAAVERSTARPAAAAEALPHCTSGQAIEYIESSDSSDDSKAATNR